MKVQIAFDLAANGLGSFFTLDDATKGVLDGTTYVLAGDVLVDVTNYVRAVSVRRGRSSALQKFTTGGASITLDNRARLFDPTNTSSPYYGSIIPRKQVVIEKDATRLFTGQVEDWNLDYTLSGDATASVACTDGFALIAQQTMNAGTRTSQSTSARISAVLDDAAWPSTQRTISTGQATLAADVVAATDNMLTYMQKVEASEPGALFMSRDGAVTFKSRTDLQTPTDITFGTGGIPFTEIQVEYGTEELFNSISVTYPTAGTATASDATSITRYGAIDLTVDSLLSSATQATNLANWLIGKYAAPTYRIRSVTVNLGGMTTAQKAQVLSLDLANVVYVTWSPPGGGSAITQYVTVDGIEHNADPGQHLVTLTLSQTPSAFIIGSSTLGIIGTNRIGF